MNENRVRDGEEVIMSNWAKKIIFLMQISLIMQISISCSSYSAVKSHDKEHTEVNYAFYAPAKLATDVI